MFGNTMFGQFPVAYVIRRASEQKKWWLRTYDEASNTCIWTSSSMKAHLFTSESVCEEYVSKYMNNRKVKIDERVVHPFAYIGG